MKNSKYLIILLALALVFVCWRWAASTSGDVKVADKADISTVQDILTRSSVRAYTEKPVDQSIVDTLLRCAMAAPTARNQQPWRFVVINQRNILDSISVKFNTMTMAKDAQLAIVVCGDLKSAMEGEGRDYWVQDASAATENLLLAAHALGLGAVWCGIYPISARVSDFSELLSLPEDIIPMACVCIGYPSGEPMPKDKWKPENIHYNKW